jgi:hypothetical protein
MPIKLQTKVDLEKIMFTDKEMQEMYEQHKDKFFDFKEFEEAVIEILAEDADKARKRADKAVENGEVA